MRLIGMLDSPYVRRVAVSLNFLGLAFKHESVSVFRQYDAFAAINPVVKAPTLVTDDGVVLMDSTLILDYVQRLAPARSLSPPGLADFARSQHIIGLALAGCEKAVQIVYEHNQRPAEKWHQPWLERVSGQMRAAWGLIEAQAGTDAWLCGERPLAPDIAVATAWSFCQSQKVVVEALGAGAYPATAAFVARAEALAEFQGTRPG